MTTSKSSLFYLGLSNLTIRVSPKLFRIEPWRTDCLYLPSPHVIQYTPPHTPSQPTWAEISTYLLPLFHSPFFLLKSAERSRQKTGFVSICVRPNRCGVLKLGWDFWPSYMAHLIPSIYFIWSSTQKLNFGTELTVVRLHTLPGVADRFIKDVKEITAAIIKVCLPRIMTAEIKGTVQRELRWVKIGINRTARINCIAGKCHFPCPKGHHHESIINVPGGCSTFWRHPNRLGQ
jgi:hypothetical protein